MAGRGAPAGTPTTYTLYAAASDNIVYTSSTTYANVTGGVSAKTLDTVTSATEYCGQYFASPNYGNYEYFGAFDTSGVAGTITSVTLSLWGLGSALLQNFTLEARAYDWGAAVDTGDYRTSAQLGSCTLLATRSTSGYTNGAYNVFTSTADFLTAINQSGITRIVVASDRFRTATTPTGSEYVWFASADTSGTANDPKLVIGSLV